MRQTRRITGPARPSHANETPEQRTELPVEDYSITAEGDPTVADFGFPASAVDAIPVYQTNAPPREFPLKRWTSETWLVGDDSQRILGAKEMRYSAVVVNNGSVNVTVGPDMGIIADAGGIITPGASLEFSHNSEVWAICASGQSADVSIFTEFYVGDDK